MSNSWTPTTPYVSVDGVVEVYKDSVFLGIVLIERKNIPLGLALPGGFVDVGEKVEDALVREMQEELTLNVEISKLLGVYSDPKRDERFHTVSVVFVAKAYNFPEAADDAKEAKVYKLDEIPLNSLVFGHKEIVQDYLAQREV